MFETFDVSAVFDLQDRVTAKLVAITEQADKLALRLDAINEKFAVFGKGTRIVSLTNKLRGMNEQLDATVASGSAAAAALDAVGASGRFGVFGGRRGGGHGGHGDMHMHGYVPLGPLDASFSAGAGIMGAAAFGYGMYQNARLDDAITRILLTSQVPVTANMRSTAQFAALKNIIQSAALQTGAPIGEIEAGALNVVRMMAGFKLKERETVLKRVLSFSALEHYLKPSVSMDEASTAMVGLMHMSGKYKPAQLNALARTMMGISLVTPLNLKQIERAASYAVPVLRAGMGINPTQVMGLMAMLQRSGVINTKSGTWARSFFTGLVPGTLGSGLFKTTNQSRALLELGLITATGKSTILNSSGHLDIIKAVNTMRAHLAAIPQVYRIKELQQAFGTRGGSFASLLLTGQFAHQWPQVQKFIHSLKSETSLLDQLYTGSEVQKARVGREKLTIAMMNLTTAVMGPLSSTLDDLNKGLTAVINWEHKHPTAAGTLGKAGAGILGAMGLGWFLKKLTGGRVTVSKAVSLADQMGAKTLGRIAPDLVPWLADLSGPLMYLYPHGLGNSTLGHGDTAYHGPGWHALGNHSTEVHTHVHLDGRKIAETVSHHVKDSVSGPLGGMSGLNGSLGLLPPNLTQGW